MTWYGIWATVQSVGGISASGSNAADRISSGASWLPAEYGFVSLESSSHIGDGRSELTAMTRIDSVTWVMPAGTFALM